MQRSTRLAQAAIHAVAALSASQIAAADLSVGVGRLPAPQMIGAVRPRLARLMSTMLLWPELAVFRKQNRGAAKCQIEKTAF